MSWSGWYAQITACRGVVGGAIVTFEGAVCHDGGVDVEVEQVAALVAAFEDASVKAVEIGENTFGVILREENQMIIRALLTPACITKTKTLLLITLGEADSNSAQMGLDMMKVRETFVNADL